jgi:hypothetical protein
MKRIKSLGTLVVGLLLLASVATNVVLYIRYEHAQNNNPDIQTQRIVDDLKKTTSIPNETPSVLTVVDKSKLTDSEIARSAQNGDKILLFQKAGKVIIYRPSTHKLINILTLNTSTPTGRNDKASSGTTPQTNSR